MCRVTSHLHISVFCRDSECRVCGRGLSNRSHSSEAVQNGSPDQKRASNPDRRAVHDGSKKWNVCTDLITIHRSVVNLTPQNKPCELFQMFQTDLLRLNVFQFGGIGHDHVRAEYS